MTNNKIAIVHEWLDKFAGSEKVTSSILKILPDAEVFSIVDFLSNKDRENILHGKFAKTTYVQNLPFAKRNFRFYFPFLYQAIRTLNLKPFKLVISSSHAFAHSVRINNGQLHICYCHSPMRYIWSMQDLYFNANGFNNRLFSLLPKLFAQYLRKVDYKTAQKVNYFIANSKFTAERIERYYQRASTVIYPPVDVERFSLQKEKQDYFVTASRLVCYKKIDILVKAFTKLPDKKLVVIGNGKYLKELKSIATPNISFVPFQRFDKFNEYMKNAKAFLFAAEEDFGITMVEAQACGTPVIAYNKGGASEIVKDHYTGILFQKQDPESVIEAIHKFEKSQDKFNPVKIRENALKFGEERFKREMDDFIKQCMNERSDKIL